MNTAVLAIDIGASSGRHMLGKLENGKLTLEEIYRFPNGTVKKNGRLCWNHQALWAHILAGMKKCAELGQIPASVGVDTWGVDYVLVDANGRMLSDGVAYRDDRTQAVLGLLPDDELYRRTGIAKQPFNTVYQLMTEPKERLQKAHRLLFTPDYFHYLLSGKMVNEYTIASTGALVNPVTRTWDAQVLGMASVPESLFPEAPKMPGTVLGRLRPQVAAEVGFDCDVILPASHDTGSAYMAVPARDDRAAYLSSGTWSLLGTELDGPVVTEKARLAGFTNEGGYQGKIRLLRNIMGLWMLQCIRRELDGQLHLCGNGGAGAGGRGLFLHRKRHGQPLSGSGEHDGGNQSRPSGGRKTGAVRPAGAAGLRKPQSGPLLRRRHSGTGRPDRQAVYLLEYRGRRLQQPGAESVDGGRHGPARLCGPRRGNRAGQRRGPADRLGRAEGPCSRPAADSGGL